MQSDLDHRPAATPGGFRLSRLSLLAASVLLGLTAAAGANTPQTGNGYDGNYDSIVADSADGSYVGWTQNRDRVGPGATVGYVKVTDSINAGITVYSGANTMWVGGTVGGFHASGATLNADQKIIWVEDDGVIGVLSDAADAEANAMGASLCFKGVTAASGTEAGQLNRDLIRNVAQIEGMIYVAESTFTTQTQSRGIYNADERRLGTEESGCGRIGANASGVSIHLVDSTLSAGYDAIRNEGEISGAVVVEGATPAEGGQYKTALTGSHGITNTKSGSIGATTDGGWSIDVTGSTITATSIANGNGVLFRGGAQVGADGEGRAAEIVDTTIDASQSGLRIESNNTNTTLKGDVFVGSSVTGGTSLGEKKTVITTDTAAAVYLDHPAKIEGRLLVDGAELTVQTSGNAVAVNGTVTDGISINNALITAVTPEGNANAYNAVRIAGTVGTAAEGESGDPMAEPGAGTALSLTHTTLTTTNSGEAVRFMAGSVLNGDVEIGIGNTFNTAEGYADLINYGTVNGSLIYDGGAGSSMRVAQKGAGAFTGDVALNVKSGTLTVADWDVAVEGQSVVSTPVTVAGTDGAKLTVEKVTITSLDDAVDFTKDIHFENTFHDEAKNQGWKPQSVVFDDRFVDSGLNGVYDAKAGIFRARFETERSAGAILSQTLANQLVRRDFFLEAAITEAAAGALYHRTLEGVDGTVFVKPYASFNDYDIGGSDIDGHTQGVLVGGNVFVGDSIVTGFVGYERNLADAGYHQTATEMDTQTWYGGLQVAHLLLTGDAFDAFVKGTAKVAYTSTEIERSYAGEAPATADTDTLAYGTNVSVGLDWKLPNRSSLIPMLGVGYSSGKTDDYRMRHSALKDRYMPERVDMLFADASVTWAQGWNRYVRTFLSGGVRYNFNAEQDARAQFDGAVFSGTYDLPGTYEFVNASLVLHVSDATEIAFGYVGVFDETGASHNGTLKYEFHF